MAGDREPNELATERASDTGKSGVDERQSLKLEVSLFWRPTVNLLLSNSTNIPTPPPLEPHRTRDSSFNKYLLNSHPGAQNIKRANHVD